MSVSPFMAVQFRINWYGSIGFAGTDLLARSAERARSRGSGVLPARRAGLPEHLPHARTTATTSSLQMDAIGVGSLPIVAMTGFFSGAVMALQMSRALRQYGQVGKTGMVVAITLVRELGPVLTALMVAGRNASGIASELGSMKVTEQIDAMRALGTDPIQKLVTPR